MSRCWVFTINNPKLGDNKVPDDAMTYMVVGEEVGEQGTNHVQGFVIMKKRTKVSTMKKFLPTAHLELMRGSSEQAADYCKKDGNFMEHGVFELIQPCRSNLTAKDRSKGGQISSEKFKQAISWSIGHEFVKLREEMPDMYFRHYHTIKRIAMDHPMPTMCLDKLDNEWIYGVPGIGKSRLVRQENDDLYIKPHSKWWLGYQGQKNVLIDDLSKTHAPWIGDFLKIWADHYPFNAETKGDGSLIRPSRILITSNYSIEELWPQDEALQEALRRRFKVRHIIIPPVFNAVPSSDIPMIRITDEETQEASMTISEHEIFSTPTLHQPEWASQSLEEDGGEIILISSDQEEL